MSDIDVESIRTAGAAIGEAISVFMLNPDTFAKSLAAGYPDPFAAYFAGRGGVLGDATGTTVTAVFAVFEPNLARSCWENGVAVHPRVGELPALLGSARRVRQDIPGRDRRAGPHRRVG